jgi:hydroxyacylglutathione hydrolase
MFQIHTIETPTLGDRSYLATDGEVALVVDPQRDIDRVLTLADSLGVRITHVLETHVHNDYVTGGYALAQHVGAEYLLHARDEVSFPRRPVRDGDVIEIGSMRVRAVHTPGHTFTHLAYAVEVDGETAAVFTGGSLLYGSTGRPDLLGDEHTETLARHQHASAHRLATELPPDAQVFPTHGFGSFCSATPTSGDSSTIGQELRQNPALTRDEETYVAELLAGLGAYPAYYAHMAPRNVAGPGAPDLSPPAEADPAELRHRIEAGEWVVDLRTRSAFAAGHLPGTLNAGLDGGFVTYLGWLIPWGTPVTLIGETAADVAEAQRELVRIGIERPAAAAHGLPSDVLTASFRTATFADLAWQTAVHGTPYVLDVRRSDERAGAFIDGSHTIPLHELAGRVEETPVGEEIWVHCAAGYRAALAASVLDAAGRTVVAIDDDFASAGATGLDLQRTA